MANEHWRGPYNVATSAETVADRLDVAEVAIPAVGDPQGYRWYFYNVEDYERQVWPIVRN